MAILSTVSGYTNVGHDLQVTLVGNTGGPITIANVMSFDWHQTTNAITHMQMNGPTLVFNMPKAYEGTIEFHRQDMTFETEVQTLQNDWLGGNDPDFFTLTCTVTGSGGGMFVFLNSTIEMQEGGMWTGEDVTRCRLAFRASTMG